MSINVFCSLITPLNFAEPVYLDNISSVFLFYVRVCAFNWTLWIGPHKVLNYSLHWSPGKSNGYPI